MHFTVIGAGAIGGTVAAHLARAGQDVVVVDSVDEHVRAIERDGLRIEGREEFRVHVPAVTPAGLPRALSGRTPKAVLLAVKALHTKAALEPLVPLLGPDTFVVSMQNGLEERTITACVGPERTVGAFVNFGADYLGPGRIMYGGAGALYLGELDGRITPRLERLGTVLRESFLAHTQLTGNIWGYLWGKLGYASMLFATATTDETMADVLAAPENTALLADLAGEVVRVAHAEGVRCEAFDGYDPDAMRFSIPRRWDAIRQSLDRLAEHNRASLKSRSGIWRDLVVRRRRTEVDYQVGAVLECARRHRLPAPLNARVAEMIHELEDGRRALTPENLDELRRLAKTSDAERGLT